jgi:hypothetical protein
MFDPVTPIITRPAQIGWQAKRRTVELEIERSFTGEELVRRMKGWVTVDPDKVIEVVKPHGRMKVLDDRELVVEFEDEDRFNLCRQALEVGFGTEVSLEAITKKSGS